MGPCNGGWDTSVFFVIINGEIDIDPKNASWKILGRVKIMKYNRRTIGSDLVCIAKSTAGRMESKRVEKENMKRKEAKTPLKLISCDVNISGNKHFKQISIKFYQSSTTFTIYFVHLCQIRIYRTDIL